MAERDGDGGQRGSGRALVLAGAAFYGVLAIFVAAGAVLLPDRFGFRVFPDSFAAGATQALAGLASGGVVILASWILVSRTRAGRRLAMMQAEAVRDVSTAEAIILAFTAGIVEEMVFRGALWTLVSSFLGGWAALAVTSVLFGAVHGAFRRGYLLWSLIATASGVLAGLLLMSCGTLFAPMLMHVLVDAVDMPLLKRMPRTSGGQSDRDRRG